MKHRDISRRFFFGLPLVFVAIPVVIGNSTADAIASGSRSRLPTYRKGLVRAVQSRLNDAGYGAGPIDGILGPRTKTAIVQFKQDKAIYPFGPAVEPDEVNGPEQNDTSIVDVDWAITAELEAALGLRLTEVGNRVVE